MQPNKQLSELRMAQLLQRLLLNISKVSLLWKKASATPGCLTEQPADTDSRASLPGLAILGRRASAIHAVCCSTFAVHETKLLLISSLGALPSTIAECKFGKKEAKGYALQRDRLVGGRWGGGGGGQLFEKWIANHWHDVGLLCPVSGLPGH